MIVKFGEVEVDDSAIHYTSKTQRQEIAVQKWRLSKGRGILDFVPRFGKTRTAILIIENYIKVSTDNRVCIVVPSSQVRTQWLIELDIQNISRHKVTVYTRGVFNKIPISEGLIVYDEIHKYIKSDLTYSRMYKYRHKFILGLTGTMPIGEDLIKLSEILPVVDVITEKEALSNNWIVPYIEYNVRLPFPKELMVEYIKYSNFIAETLKLFNGMAKKVNSIDVYNDIYFGFKTDYDVLMSCLTGRKDLTSQRYIAGKEVRDIVGKTAGWSTQLNLHKTYDKSVEEYWSPDAIIKRVVTFNNFIRERNTLTVENDDKLKAILTLIRKDENKATLVYAGTIAFAEQIKDAINAIYGYDAAITFHSKIPSQPIIDEQTNDYFKYQSGVKKGLPKIFGKNKLKEFYINGIKSNKYKVIVTVESLNEGLNIPNLERVITTAGSVNTITHKQRTARVKTIDELNLSKNGVIYNVYFDDFVHNGEYYKSRDKGKLLLRQQDSTSAPIYTNLEDK